MKEHYDLVISGMGPAGMACALTVVENMDKSILIISNRGDEFFRVQHIIFDMGVFHFFNEIIKKIPHDGLDNMPYLRKMKGNLFKIGVALKDVERALHECIKFLPNIDVMYFSELSKINMENGIAEITDLKDEIKKTSVSFSHIIGADGVKHHAANIYNASCSLNEDKIHYKPSALSSDLHPWHFFFCLTLSTKDGSPIRVPEKSFFVSVLEESSSTELQLLGMMFLYPSRKPAKSNQLRIKLSSDITEELYMRLKVDAGRDDAMRLVQNHVEDALKQSGFTESEISNIEIGNPGLSVKSGIKKDAMKWQVFRREIMVSSRSIVEKNGRKFILIGDALRSPDYQVGHGVNDVFSMLWTLNSLMTDPAQELVSWQEKSATLSSDVDFMENIILSEKKKYAQMLSEKTDLMLMDNLKNEFIALFREKNKDELSIFLAGKRISPIEFLPYAFSIINDPEMQDFLLHQTIDNLDLSVIDTISPFSLSGGLINRAISAGASAELIGFLLEKGVQPNVKYRLSTYDNFDNSSLRSACRAGKAELVQVLFAHKSIFNGLTPDYLIALKKALFSYCFYMEQDNRVEITGHIDAALSIMQATQSEAAPPIEEASTKYYAPARAPSPPLSFFRAAQSAPVPMSPTMVPQASTSGSK